MPLRFLAPFADGRRREKPLRGTGAWATEISARGNAAAAREQGAHAICCLSLLPVIIDGAGHNSSKAGHGVVFIPHATPVPKSPLAGPPGRRPSRPDHESAPIDAMAAPARVLRRLQVAVSLPGLRPASRRLVTTASRNTPPTGVRSGVLRPLSREFRRYYADAPTATLTPAPKKRPRFRWLRWTWRLTYLSALGGIAYVGYAVYVDRHPAPQSPPDPSKKTLVILGASLLTPCPPPEPSRR